MKRSNAWERILERLLLQPLLSILERKSSDTMPVPRRVLICKSCCLGDAVLTLYAIREFREEHPSVAIEVLCSDRIREVYEDSPLISVVHSLPVTGRRLLRELISPSFLFRLLSTLLKLRRIGFDWFVDLELYRGYGPALKRILGIPHSRGFHVEGLAPPAHDFVFFRGRKAPEWQCFYGVLGLPAPALPPPALYSRTPHPVTARRLIGIVFGSSFNWPEKKWPLEHFISLIRLLENDPVEFVLFGSAFEAPEADQIKASAPDRVRSTAGCLNFGGLRDELGRCDLVVGNDTGALHVAAGCDVPTVAFFGPTSPEKWKPLTAEVLVTDIHCRPCYYLGAMPECSHRNCLHQLFPEKAGAAIRKKLSLAPDQPFNLIG